MIQEKDKNQIANLFKSLENEVKIITFTQEFECQFCRINRELLEEVKALSEKISIETYDFVKDADFAKKYNIDKIPATIITGDNNYGIRYFGVPGGYEFTSLIEDIIDISKRKTLLSQNVLKNLSNVDQPVHIQVLTSPTCPYCAIAVRTAHRFAMENNNIVADMIDLIEFPNLAVKYNVQSYPLIVINEKHFIHGAPSETDFLNEILKAIGKKRL
ncbi:MAG: thioredoxin family protein [Nitrospirae bacterium]|jgi:glutaredoxin-like protein|nr:thioredoxin family protein [Nitrospirota bacterium]